ncbi:hypothetical protein AFR_11385 [Actinoplanes friuliensis DSM 7358]|uniref:Uncharacterized protein n=1 Tax=Actinoplanes friuliensis DSM 7358 TaxID=1246995 RepID=U5VY59_9ACTN|nr:hypothetical protein AFR_11385 [Actinoplanes friuliensis DSM 7358]
MRERYAPGPLTGPDTARSDEQFSAIDLFAHLLVDGMHVTRVGEDVRVTGDMLVNDVTIEVSLEALQRLRQLPDEGKVVIPILRRKELMLESFEARDGADNRLAHLPQHLTDGLLAWAIKGLFQLAYAPDHELTTTQNSKLYRLIGLICRTDIIDPAEFEVAYTAIVGNTGGTGADDPQLLRSICGYFAGNTVSAVEVDVAEAEQIYVRFQDITTNNRLASSHDRHRTRLGIRPYRYRIPINLAYYAHIYDLSVTGHESHFVFKHYLVESAGQTVNEVLPSHLATEPGMGLRLDRNQGIPHTGLHIRGLNRAVARNLECVAEFEEIPPGALRRTLVISAVCSFVMLAFAFAMPNAVSDSKGTDLAALLLAVPGFAATLVGISTDRVQQSSLTTFIGLVVSASISFAASLLYVLQTLLWRESPQLRLSILGVVKLPSGDVVWMVFAALSICTTVYLTVEGTYRMHRYLAALRRRLTPSNAQA